MPPRYIGCTKGKTFDLSIHPIKNDSNGLVIFLPKVLRFSKAKAAAAALKTMDTTSQLPSTAFLALPLSIKTPRLFQQFL